MLVLISFALAYALLGTVTQVGRDAGGGMRMIRQKAWSAATGRVASMRAGGPRDVGWWLWLTGASAYYTGRTAVRGSRLVGRSVRTGWSAGWRRGKDRYEQRTVRRSANRSAADRGEPVRSLADRWRSNRRTDQRAERGPGASDGPAPGETADNTTSREPDAMRSDHETADRTLSRRPGAGAAVALARCNRCGAYTNDEHACAPHEDVVGEMGYGGDLVDGGDCRIDTQSPTGLERSSDRHDAGVRDGKATGIGALAVVSNMTGEAPNIEMARTTLQALRTEAEQTVVRVDQLSASLQSANVDSQTLGEVAEVLEAADVLKTAADKAFNGMQLRHAAMEEAVNSTPHAAKTDWYKH